MALKLSLNLQVMGNLLFYMHNEKFRIIKLDIGIFGTQIEMFVNMTSPVCLNFKLIYMSYIITGYLITKRAA